MKDNIPVHIIRTTDFWCPESLFDTITYKELMKYRARVYKEMTVDWSTLSEDITHVVFYSELRDPKDNVEYATIYLGGASEKCTEDYFESHYNRPRQFVVALHRP